MMTNGILPDEHQCDFCDSKEIKYSYPCNDLRDPTGLCISVGDWAACEICHNFIEANNWYDLAIHSAQTHPLVKHGIVTFRQAYDYASRLHKSFNANRKGEPVAID